MLDVFWALFEVDQYTFTVVLTLVGFVCWLTSIILGNNGLAVIFSPFLLIAGLAANRWLAQSVVLITDKDTNIAAASAIGILTALVLMLTGLWIASSLAQRKSNAPWREPPTKLPPPAK